MQSAAEAWRRVRREQGLAYALDPTLDPVLTVEQGERFVVETEDASSGLMAEAEELPSPLELPYTRHTPARANPLAGPVFVRGVGAGSRLKVEIVSIELARRGACWTRPATSPFGDSRQWADLSEPFAQGIEHRDGFAHVSERLRVPLAPMLGTLACAPEWEILSSTLAQGPWGGNLDVADFRIGAHVYLNTYHEGGLLFLGDVHGCQGDGEVIGAADETRAEVVLAAEAVDGPPLPAPRLETDERIVALGIDKPLEVAAHRAVRHLLDWLVSEHDLCSRDAYLAIGLHPGFRLRVYQMTSVSELRFVVGASLPKAVLGGGE